MRELDARGLICPLPVLRARKILLTMAAGEKLRVVANDRNTEKDFPLFCAESGHRLDSLTLQGSDIVIIVSRAADDQMPAAAV